MREINKGYESRGAMSLYFFAFCIIYANRNMSAEECKREWSSYVWKIRIVFLKIKNVNISPATRD